ncbi:SMP-30/gluconolactonase/LRE family protein [Edaphosphingomonas haloaromaticamans]|uniref:L-arabinolactonase n=1 Tax=Edaphosphingomonas haloaromaticamans TaxID=653954 RepID=A0A1S1HGP3_9SPHN|nr:SMP-30/gluconolactonase/LRE family protein [Sphingomonas haloaromaticamans]OHT20626.1 L-arabinolactonase [Sphingomonas haloaromaticamans]
MAAVRVVPRDRVDVLGEGLFWSVRDGALLWTDILGRRINRFRPATGQVESWEVGDVVGWIIGRAKGGFVAGIGRSIAQVSFDPFICETLADIPGEPATNRVNDAAADPQGQLWLGTMPYACDAPTGSFYRFSKGGISRAAPEPFTIPNGPAIDPTGRFLLHTDSAMGVIFRHELHDGVLGPREPFVTFENGWGSPDGMAFDAEGHLWVACWGAGCVTRFSPEGRPVRRIELPASQISNCTFGGADLDRLYVTSAADGVDEEHGGALFEVDPGCRGLPPFPYED